MCSSAHLRPEDRLLCDGHGTERRRRLRRLVVLEIVEVFMRAQGLGWVGSRNEGSEGEGLSRFLAAQFLALNGFGNPPAQFQNSSTWLASERADFVNNPATADAGPDKVTGCALLFIWYLFSQLGFGINAIVAAGATPLSAVYKKLMSDPRDPFPLFKALLEKILPGKSDATVAIPGASTRTDADGSFTVANVPPGTYEATASAGRHYTADTETVTVNEGQATAVNFILTLKVRTRSDLGNVSTNAPRASATNRTRYKIEA